MRGKDSHELGTEQRLEGAIPPLFPSPCGEKIVMNDEERSISPSSSIRFPSPCGEKIVMNTAFFGGVYLNRSTSFPSPCGEKIVMNTEQMGR